MTKEILQYMIHKNKEALDRGDLQKCKEILDEVEFQTKLAIEYDKITLRAIEDFKNSPKSNV